MTYQVIARKWRPQTFDELIGQFHISNTLKNAILNDRVGHAFLFTGVRGVGKTTTARILAKRLSCDNPVGGNPCNKCAACKDVQDGKHIDIVEMDGASNTGIDDVKVLRESARYLPSRGKYKIYIIDEVHMLSEKAFNALLKTLEEPPPHVKFIFATTDPHKIPITIKSRCQIYDFRSISIDEIFNQLKLILDTDGIKYEDSALYLISKKAEGSMRDAQSLLEQVIAFASNNITKLDVLNILGVTDSDVLFDMTKAILNNSIEDIILIIDKLIKSGINLIHFYKELIEHFHSIMIAKNVKDPYKVLKMPKFEIERYIEQSKEFDDSFVKIYQLLIDGFDQLKASQFQRITFEMSMIKIASFKPVTPLKDILKFVNKLSKTFENNPDSKKIEIDLFSMMGRSTSKYRVPIEKAQIIEKEEAVESKHTPSVKDSHPAQAGNITNNQLNANGENMIDVPKSIDFDAYKKIIGPFFAEIDGSYQYFYQQIKLPISYEDNTLILEYPNDAEVLFGLHPNFKEMYLSWLKENLNKDLKIEIKLLNVDEKDTYFGILSRVRKEADREELRNIRDLEGVRKVEEVLNLKVKKIIRGA